jgi:hypothetical protein
LDPGLPEFMLAERSDIYAVENNLTGVRVYETIDAPKQCRLA